MRILTNRAFPFPKFQWEAIEKTENGFQWIGSDICDLEINEDGKIVFHTVGFGFPVEEWFVKEKFTECGRTYRRMPLEATEKAVDEFK